MNGAVRVFKLRLRDDLHHFLLARHHPQKSQYRSDFAHIHRLLAVVIENQEGIRDFSLQVVGDVHWKIISFHSAD